MLEYDRIDISDAIDVDMSHKSKECMLCHYSYFLDKNFSYGPYLCDGCYNMMQKCSKLKNIATVLLKCIQKKKLMTNSNLIDKKRYFIKNSLIFFHYIKNG